MTENCIFMLLFIYTIVHGASWHSRSNRTPVCYSKVGGFFPSTPINTVYIYIFFFLNKSWDNVGNWIEIPFFSAVSLITGVSLFLESAPWSEISLFSFRRPWRYFLIAAGLALIWNDTAFLYRFQKCRTSLSLQPYRERSGLINIHIWRKKSLEADNCSGELWPSAVWNGWFNPLNKAWRGKADRTLITGSRYYNYQ